jgi:hypothetical protein
MIARRPAAVPWRHVPRLLLGPMLRHVGPDNATIWVETDGPCEVEVLGRRAPTFQVAGHHYALVVLHDLAPGTCTAYEVRLDGAPVWPEAGSPFPPSVIRVPAADKPVHLAFGSCRVAVPHDPPWSLTKDADPRGREVDALVALTHRVAAQDPADRPDLLLLVGDQVYADEASPRTRERIAARRGEGRPGGPEVGGVADFEEYTWLYHESWRDPAVRWLLSTLASAMIFDDHDVHDDWNTSQAWVDEIRRRPWWPARIEGAYMTYWLYQHLGNLSPAELAEDGLWQRVKEGGEQTEAVRRLAQTAHEEVATTRWSFRRDLGSTRLVVLDSRAGRILDEGGRQMLSDGEWRWVEEQLDPCEYEHLVLATSLPWLLAPALHHLETWNERVCGGAWGRTAARAGEKLRQGLDLEHWSAFNGSFDRLTDLLAEIGSGARGPAPKTISVLSGDVHHAYVAEASFPRDHVTSKVAQAVCSPLRNPLDRRERRALRAAVSRPAAAVTRALARAAGVPPERVAWRFAGEPTFDNQVAFLDLGDHGARVAIAKTVPEDWREPRLHESFVWTTADGVTRR